MREINEAGIELIKRFEGIPDGDPSTVNKDPYLDPVGIWTIGWGHAIRHNGKFLRGEHNRTLAMALYPGGYTIEQCESLLRADLMDYSRDVQAMLQREATDNQFDALVSFAFNAGVNALRRSTLLRLFHAGDIAGAGKQFKRWNKGTIGGVKVVLAGLTRRRLAEAELFLL